MPEFEFQKKVKFPKPDGSFVEFEIFQLNTSKENGFTLVAKETAESKGKRFGYSFEANSSISLLFTLDKLVKKIRKVLSMRYLDREKGVPFLTHNLLLGRISYSEKEKDIVLEVDGRKITKKEFWKMIKSYEGWEIQLKINEP